MNSSKQTNIKFPQDSITQRIIKQYRSVMDRIKSSLLEIAPKRFVRWLRIRKHKDNYIPPVGKIQFADMRRLKPFDNDFGFSRGQAIDRYYIENFLEKNTNAIQGCVLEVLNDAYIKKFGGSKVTYSDILDINQDNKLATVIADLSKADSIPSNTYDCIILTQTLQLIYDVKSVIRHIHRILKPAGVLLLTVPGITNFSYKIYGSCWSWSFTSASVQKLLLESFHQENIKIQTFGNVLVAASFLYGIGWGELTKDELDYNDQDYQLIITAKAIKSIASTP